MPNENTNGIDSINNMYLSIRTSLWNSLITLNALLLSLISILFILNPTLNKTFVIFLFTICFLAIISVIINYLVVKKVFEHISYEHGRLESIQDKTERNTYRTKENNHYDNSYKKINIIEKTSISLSIVGVVSIFIFIIFS